MATKAQLEAMLAGKDLEIAALQARLGESMDNIQQLQRALSQTCRKLDQATRGRQSSFGIPKEVRERFFQAHPGMKSATNQQIINWARSR